MHDMEQLRQSRAKTEQANRKLQSLGQIAQAAISSLDRSRIVEVMATQVVGANFSKKISIRKGAK